MSPPGNNNNNKYKSPSSCMQKIASTQLGVPTNYQTQTLPFARWNIGAKKQFLNACRESLVAFPTTRNHMAPWQWKGTQKQSARYTWQVAEGTCELFYLGPALLQSYRLFEKGRTSYLFTKLTA